MLKFMLNKRIKPEGLLYPELETERSEPKEEDHSSSWRSSTAHFASSRMSRRFPTINIRVYCKLWNQMSRPAALSHVLFLGSV